MYIEYIAIFEQRFCVGLILFLILYLVTTCIGINLLFFKKHNSVHLKKTIGIVANGNICVIIKIMNLIKGKFVSKDL